MYRPRACLGYLCPLPRQQAPDGIRRPSDKCGVRPACMASAGL